MGDLPLVWLVQPKMQKPSVRGARKPPNALRSESTKIAPPNKSSGTCLAVKWVPCYDGATHMDVQKCRHASHRSAGEKHVSTALRCLNFLDGPLARRLPVSGWGRYWWGMNPPFVPILFGWSHLVQTHFIIKWSSKQSMGCISLTLECNEVV